MRDDALLRTGMGNIMNGSSPRTASTPSTTVSRAIRSFGCNNVITILFLLSFYLPTGFTQSIPGYPRYSVLGDSGQGIYNLRIVNVTLEDDAEYQCQVGPYMHHKLIRAKARLTVIGK